MTQSNMSQPPTSEELWAAYVALEKQEKELRERWDVLRARFHRVSEVSSAAFERSHAAWEKLLDVFEERERLREMAVEAERSGCADRERDARELTV